MKLGWNQMTSFQKILLVLRMIFAFLVVFFGFLQLTNVCSDANHVAIPLFGVIMLLQAISDWKISKRVFWVDIILFLLIFACSFTIWFLK